MMKFLFLPVSFLLFSLHSTAQGLQSFMTPDAVTAITEEHKCFNAGASAALAEEQPEAYQKGHAAGLAEGQKIALAMAQDSMMRLSYLDKKLAGNRPFLIYTLMSNFWTEDEEQIRNFGALAAQEDVAKIQKYFNKGVLKGEADYAANPGKAKARDEDLIHSDRFLRPDSKKKCDQAGRTLAITANTDEWTAAGYQVGLEEGKTQFASILTRLEEETAKNIDNPKLFTKLFFGDWIKTSERNTELFFLGRKEALKSICQDAYVRGYRQGWKDSYRKDLWNKAERPAQEMYQSDLPLTMDYSGMMAHLETFEKSGFEDKKAFFAASEELYNAVGNHLMTLLAGSLDPTEKNLFREYVKAHAPGLTESDYELFMTYNGQKNRAFSLPYAQYNFSQTVESFLDVVEVSLCPLVHEGLLYAKANPNFVGNDEETKVDLCGMVKKEVLPQLDVTCAKMALQRDLDLNIPALNTKMAEVINMLPAGTREHVETVEESFSEGDVYFTVTMDIISRVEIGYVTDKAELTINHAKNQFELAMSDMPRELNILDQTYRIKNIEVRNRGANQADEDEECDDCPTKIDEKVSEKTLVKIFNAKKTEVSFDDILKNSIKNTSLLEPMIVQVLEPSLSAAAGCYSVALFFGDNRAKTLAKADCK